MIYNTDFLISALVFLLVILFHFFTERKIGQATQVGSRIFFCFMLVGVANIFFDLICTFFISAENPALSGLTEAFLIALYIMQILVPYVLFGYLRSLQGPGLSSTPFGIAVRATPAAFMILMILANHWTGLLFHITEAGVYVRGPLYLTMYACAALYGVMIAADSILHRGLLGKHQFRVIWEYMLVMVSCLSIQAVFNDLLVTGFGISLGIAILFLALNNPYHYSDSLTGLLDLQYFHTLCQRMMDSGRPFNVLSIDLIRLKQLSQLLGATSANRLLQLTAGALRTQLKGSLVFRATGSRMVVVLRTQEEFESARKVLENLFSAPMELDGIQIHFPAVLCGVFHCETLEKGDVLLSYLDYLASTAPSTGGTVYVQGEEKTLAGFRYNQQVEQFLATAIKYDLFQVAYQPVYSAKAGGYVALEVLSRLTHPDLGPIPPDLFIALAEKNDQIATLGLLQLRRVCAFLRDNPRLMETIQNIKINLSPAELLKQDHGDRLVETIRSFGLPPSFFQFEITETVATQYTVELAQSAADFRAAGIGLCLDDFGSGYANLNTVLRLPFTTIKLDRSLLAGICGDSRVAAFYRGIVNTLTSLDYSVVAEGVETEEELSLIRQFGVDLVQGFCFSRPIPGPELLALLLPAPTSA